MFIHINVRVYAKFYAETKRGFVASAVNVRNNFAVIAVFVFGLLNPLLSL